MPFKDVIEKTVCLSTAHVTKKTMDTLVAMSGDASAPFMVCGYECGVWVLSLAPTDYDADAVFASGLGGEIFAVMNLVRQHDIYWFRLDADGDKVDELPVFEW
jgi:hypothetical protein